MKTILLCALCLFTPVAVVAAAQNASHAGNAGRKTGTIFKDEVDTLIRVIRDRARRGGNAAPLGGDSVLVTAQVLCAMGHSHRFYHISDGPVVRPSLHFLIRARNADGSYGQKAEAAETTAWVADALEVMDKDGYRDEIATARGWLAQNGANASSGFRAAVEQVMAEVRADRFPQHLGAEGARYAHQVLAEPATLELRHAARRLVELVACQAANRLLDGQQGQDEAAPFSPSQQRAFAFVLGQQKEGVFRARHGGREFPDPAFTGFGLLALQTKPAAKRSQQEQAIIDQGMRWLLQQQNEDGSFGQQVQNYTTSVVIGALARWHDPAKQPVLEKAQRYILACQNAEQAGYQSSDRDYGSIGYGGSQRGDLSNLNFALQALRESGLPADHEAFSKALVFLQRTQNLRSVNDFTGKTPDPDQGGKIVDAIPGDDGGSAYYPGNSAAGYIVQPDGKSVPRSYGSMTYALLKAYMLCGLQASDPRVQAAVRWIQANWTLAVNPGFDPALGERVQYQGLFYYYMMLGQALDLVGVREVTIAGEDGKPTQVDWRKALRQHLEGMQQADGSWANTKNSRWMEDSALLCTCYAMMALEHCR